MPASSAIFSAIAASKLSIIADCDRGGSGKIALPISAGRSDI
jgi:hypothetical protein